MGRLRIRTGRVGGQAQVVDAEAAKFGEALAQQRADEELGAGQVGLEDGQLQVEGRVGGRVGGGGGWDGALGAGTDQVFDFDDLYWRGRSGGTRVSDVSKGQVYRVVRLSETNRTYSPLSPPFLPSHLTSPPPLIKKI